MRAALLGIGCWLLGAVALVAFAGCGGTQPAAETTPEMRVTAASLEGEREAWIALDGYKGAQTVGILMAQELGYFGDEGVEMTITSAAAPEGAIDYVREQMVDFGVTRQPQLALARGEGVPLVAVGALVARPTAALIWLKGSGIHGIADLKGRTIGIPGLTFQEDFLRSLLGRHGLTLDDVKISHLGYESAQSLASGQTDAIFGGSWNVEGAALAAQGLKPVIHRMQSLGFPAYDEQVLVARTGQVAEDGQLIRDVLAAIARGTAAAIEHPRAAVSTVEETDEGDLFATPKQIEAEVEATLPLLSETGYMDPGEAKDLVDRMHAEGWIKRAIPSARLLTNDYLSIAER